MSFEVTIENLIGQENFTMKLTLEGENITSLGKKVKCDLIDVIRLGC